jgi:hypothetical protein
VEVEDFQFFICNFASVISENYGREIKNRATQKRAA